MSVSEGDYRSNWNALAFQGEQFTRTITLSSIAASDTATYKILATVGGSALLTLTSSSGITVTSGSVTWTVAGGSMPANVSGKSTPYYHYLEILTNTGALRALFAGTFIYAERERWPLT